MFANIYTCFPPQIVFLATVTGSDLSVTLTRAMVTFCGPDLLYIICGNGNFSQAVRDSSFPLWPTANVVSTLGGSCHSICSYYVSWLAKFIYQQIKIISRHWCDSCPKNTGPALRHWLIICLAVKISLNFCKLWLVCIVLFIYYHTIKIQMLLKAFFKIFKGLTLEILPEFYHVATRDTWQSLWTSSQFNLNSPV